jgi:hypothetical protein
VNTITASFRIHPQSPSPTQASAHSPTPSNLALLTGRPASLSAGSLASKPAAAKRPVVSVDTSEFKNPTPLARKLKAAYDRQLGTAMNYAKRLTGRDVPFKLIYNNQEPGRGKQLANTNWGLNPPEITIHLYDNGSGQLAKNYVGNTSDESVLVALTHEVMHAASSEFIKIVTNDEALNSPSLSKGMPPFATPAPTNTGLSTPQTASVSGTLIEGTADLFANQAVANGAKKYPSGTYWNHDRYAEQLNQRLPEGVLKRVMFNTNGYPAYQTERKLVTDTLNTIRLESYAKAADQVLAGNSSLKTSFKENHLLLLAYYHPQHALVKKFEAAFATKNGVKLNLAEFAKMAGTSELSKTPDEVDAENRANPFQNSADPQIQAYQNFLVNVYPPTLRKIYALWPSVVDGVPLKHAEH